MSVFSAVNDVKARDRQSCNFTHLGSVVTSAIFRWVCNSAKPSANGFNDHLSIDNDKQWASQIVSTVSPNWPFFRV